MTRVAFDHVWKKFRRGLRHDSLRDLLPALVARWRRPSAAGLDREEFWAVRDVSFEVAPGQALGLIGANGAGKSTILKLLTRILKPTRGHCEIRGRVGALIEVAAGFHPDLTGGENIYLQGAVMGMKRADIARRFDEIVEFSGLAAFIDTPVKRYSSGMSARLGFAVAAHLDPDVLLIDEVLAVGDFAFQQRAFGRLQELRARRIPIVVVSHQLDRISAMCTHAILLHEGAMLRHGTPSECIAEYVLARRHAAAGARAPMRLTSLRIDSPLPARSGERLRFTLAMSADDDAHRGRPRVMIDVRSVATGGIVFLTSTTRNRVELPAAGDFELETELQMNVSPGAYLLETSLWDDGADVELQTGPTAYLEVAPGASFDGVVQMNARMDIQRR